MRKLICFLLIICLIPAIALSETDLSSLSLDELIALRIRIEKEIVSRSEWKSVTVPTGEWLIGEDIPEGYYSVKTTGKLTIIQAAPSGSNHDDFYHGLSADESVGKLFFPSGSIFKTSNPVILEPPKGLGF